MKKLVHHARGFHVALRVDFEFPTGGIERRVQSQASEYIGDDAVLGNGVVHSAGREQREMVGGGEIGEEFDFTIFAANAMALKFNEQVVTTKNR